MVAYLITLKCAEKFHKHYLPVRFTSDDYTHYIKEKYKLEYYGINPEPVSLNNVKSSIWNKSREWLELKKSPSYISLVSRVINKIKTYQKR